MKQIFAQPDDRQFKAWP